MTSQDKPTRRESDLQLALLVEQAKNNDKHFDALHKKVDCITDAIKGKDNNPGIVTRLSVAETNISTIEKDISRTQKFIGGLSAAIMTGLIKIFYK